MIRYRRPVLVAIAFLVLTPLSACAADPGPLVVPNPHGYGGIIIDAGGSFTDAFEVISAPEHGEVTLLQVRELGSSGLTLDGVYLASEQREANFQYEPRFPPTEYGTGTLVAAAGATLLPDHLLGEMKGYELIFHYVVPREGKYVRDGYVIDYEYEGDRYSVEITAEITVCTPEFVEPDGTCPMREEG